MRVIAGTARRLQLKTLDGMDTTENPILISLPAASESAPCRQS